MQFGEGVSQVWFTISKLWKFFKNQMFCFWGKFKTQMWEGLEQIYVTKQEFLASKKY